MNKRDDGETHNPAIIKGPFKMDTTLFSYECKPQAWAVFAARVIAIVCFSVIACAMFGAGERAYAAVSEFDYDGDELKFMAGDGGRFGMYEAQEGSWTKYEDGQIIVEHITGNTTIYAGFYLEADKSDSSTWDEAKFYPRNEGGWLSFRLDASYAGKAWPVAPVQVKNPTVTTGGQYYLAVPALEYIPGYQNTVTFTDGEGNELAVETVFWGESATPPEVSEREGFTFIGWDCDYDFITEDTTVNALWVENEATYYTVVFEDGWGNKLSSQMVKEGKAATAPAEPKHDGYTFIGWEPESFDNITENITVKACWVNSDELALTTAKDAIAALPANPKSILRDTDNELVAQAADAYLALSDELKAHLTDEELLLLARCAIAVLPSDSFKVTSGHSNAIGTAEAIYESLPENLQAEIDSNEPAKVVSSSRSYGRYLENAVWALDALRSVNNVTLLATGTYTGQVDSASSMGKSNSQRKLTFTVKSVTVKGGKATAIIEHSSNTSQYVRLGGVEYENLQTDSDKHSYYEIPLNLNSTFHFSVKGKDAKDDTDAISYEMTVSADTSSMKADPDEGGSSGGKSSGSSGKSAGSASSGSASRTPSTTKTSTASASSSGSTSNTSSTGSALSASNSGNSTTSNQTGSSTTASALKASNTSNKNSTSSASSASASKASASKTDSKAKSDDATAVGASNDARISEVSVEDSDGGSYISAGPDLTPAIAGGVILSVSGGVLAFVLNFVRRESAML